MPDRSGKVARSAEVEWGELPWGKMVTRNGAGSVNERPPEGGVIFATQGFYNITIYMYIYIH